MRLFSRIDRNFFHCLRQEKGVMMSPWSYIKSNGVGYEVHSDLDITSEVCTMNLAEKARDSILLR